MVIMFLGLKIELVISETDIVPLNAFSAESIGDYEQIEKRILLQGIRLVKKVFRSILCTPLSLDDTVRDEMI